jgi:hypothetical protein
LSIDWLIDKSTGWSRKKSHGGRQEVVMPLIAPQLRPDRQVLSVKVDIRILTLLKHYTDFITSAQDYVTSQALLVTFSKDADFQTWLRETHPDDLAQLRVLLAERQSPAVSRRAAATSTRHTGE